MTTGPALHNSRTFRSSTFSIVLQLMQYEILTERPVFDLSKNTGGSWAPAGFFVWGHKWRRRIASAEGARIEAPKGVGCGEGYPPPQPTRGSGERHQLPQRGLGRSSGRKRF